MNACFARMAISPVDFALEPLVDRSQPGIRPQSGRDRAEEEQDRRQAQRPRQPSSAVWASFIIREINVGGLAWIG